MSAGECCCCDHLPGGDAASSLEDEGCCAPRRAGRLVLPPSGRLSPEFALTVDGAGAAAERCDRHGGLQRLNLGEIGR